MTVIAVRTPHRGVSLFNTLGTMIELLSLPVYGLGAADSSGHNSEH